MEEPSLTTPSTVDNIRKFIWQSKNANIKGRYVLRISIANYRIFGFWSIFALTVKLMKTTKYLNISHIHDQKYEERLE